MYGMLHIYSGNGKGKTTAGFGLVLRQAGYESFNLCKGACDTNAAGVLFSNAGAGAAGN